MAPLAPAQATLWIGLLTFNGITIRNVGSLLAMAGALTLVLVGAGVLTALLVPNRQRAQLLYSLSVLAAFLPEHPPTTVARLAIGSPTETTFLLVGGYVVAGIAIAVAIRAYVGRLNPEGL